MSADVKKKKLQSFYASCHRSSRIYDIKKNEEKKKTFARKSQGLVPEFLGLLLSTQIIKIC
jgi:hypothetical protein